MHALQREIKVNEMAGRSMSGPLDDHVAVVAGGAFGVGSEVVEVLHEAGADVVAIGPIPGRRSGASQAVLEIEADLDDQAAVVAAFERSAKEHGRAAVSVYAYIDPEALTPRPVVELSLKEWDRLAEAPIRSILWWIQNSAAQMVGHGGRIVSITPTVAIEGAIGLAALATAGEGQRGLIKSAARHWGDAGITANIVAPAVWELSPALDGTDAGRNVPSIPIADNRLREVANAVMVFASPYASRLTGVTINADSGALMSP